jgi:hypothetical protein
VSPTISVCSRRAPSSSISSSSIAGLGFGGHSSSRARAWKITPEPVRSRVRHEPAAALGGGDGEQRAGFGELAERRRGGGKRLVARVPRLDPVVPVAVEDPLARRTVERG